MWYIPYSMTNSVAKSPSVTGNLRKTGNVTSLGFNIQGIQIMSLARPPIWTGISNASYMMSEFEL